MTLISFLFRTSRGAVLLAVVIGVASGAGSAALIGLINTALHSPEIRTANAVLNFAGLCLLVLVSGVVSQALLIHLGQGAILDLRMRLCRRALAASLRQLEDIGKHRLQASLSDDVIVIADALLNFPLLCINVAITIVCLVYLGWLSMPLLLLVLVFVAMGVIVHQILSRKAMRYLRVAREQQDALFHGFRGLSEGIKELKLNSSRREEFMTGQLYPAGLSFRRHTSAAMMIFAVAGGWSQLLYFVLVGLLLFGISSLRGVDSLILTGYALTILYMMGALAVVVGMSAMMGRANVALQKLDALGLSLVAHQKEDPAPRDAEVSWQHLELRGASHTYHREWEDESFLLGPIDLSFRRGELVFMVGGNGSGKTTFAKLLTGLYVPDGGEILLDGKPVTDRNREAYRQQFSAVFYDFYLFEKLLGFNDLDDVAREYLSKLHLDRKVAVKDGTFSTTALSQGQRKRLALLVAYLEDRSFYVFDEWASDQDPLFKEVFYTRLLPELRSRGKTILVITHDDKYFHLADRLLKLDYGKLELGGQSLSTPCLAAEVPETA